jgi:hypothetical protein
MVRPLAAKRIDQVDCVRFALRVRFRELFRRIPLSLLQDADHAQSGGVEKRLDLLVGVRFRPGAPARQLLRFVFRKIMLKNFREIFLEDFRV